MKSDLIYFADTGLTSTSASHIANMAKESTKNIANELSAISFFSTTICLLSGGTPQQVKIGSTRDKLDEVDNALVAIGEANALIAWLREAIKARERLLAEVKNMTLEDYCKNILGDAEVPRTNTNISEWLEEHGYTMPDINGDFPGTAYKPVLGSVLNRLSRFCEAFNLTMPKEPKQAPAMTEDEYMASLSVKDRNRFLMLEAKAAVIGKFIHEDGHLDRERNKLRQIMANPIATDGEGNDKAIYRFEPSVTNTDVEGLFFRLAATHRSTQAELNGLLAERARAIEADKQAKAAAYQQESEAYAREINRLQDKLAAYMNGERRKLSEYQSEYEAWATEQKNRHKQLCADLALYKIEEAKRIAAFGIAIPHELQPIYDRINGLGKQS